MGCMLQTARRGHGLPPRIAAPDNPPMHLLIPFAAPLSEAGRQARGSLSLPQLRRLLAQLEVVGQTTSDEWTFTAPHEAALARELGWSGADGLLPWAARQAAADGLDVAGQAWGLVTPAHWHVGTDQVSLIDPQLLALDEAGSRAFFSAVKDLYTGDGYTLHWAAPLRWYVAHDSLATLRTASLDRVVGRNVDAWLGTDPAARRLRRLQSEVQMVLYTDPLNDERIARGLLPVNSFWLSGCGLPQTVAAPEPTVDSRLRSPALNEDWAAWVKAWDTLDGGPVADAAARAERGEPVRLTLCGERGSLTWQSAPRGFWRGLRTRLSALPDLHTVLEPL